MDLDDSDSDNGVIIQSNLKDHDGIVDTCKRLRQEARPILLASTKIIIYDRPPDGATFAMRTSYRSQIQRVTVHDGILSLNDVLAFTALRHLRIRGVPTEDARDSWGISVPLSAAAVEAFAIGSIDQRIKEREKKAYLTIEDPGFKWIKEAVELPSRTFNISSTLTLCWKPKGGRSGLMVSDYMHSRPPSTTRLRHNDAAA